MCGLFGVVSRGAALSDDAVRAAHEVQQHRGPDGIGAWHGTVDAHSVTLGHQRLSIIDLSVAGAQPMRRGDDEVLVYNGEIYNYLELRSELERAGVVFRTRTDTEVVLAALRHWGAEAASQRFNGMWALAWLDRSGRRLVLSRDRAGEKPLYYTHADGALFFASEIKTLLSLTGRRYAVNATVVARYLGQSLVDATDETFFEGIRKLPPACVATVPLAQDRPLDVRPRPYWQGRVAGDVAPFPRFVEELASTFLDAVDIRLRSDVPVGVLLSGGLDSSCIAAAMHELAGPDGDVNLLSAVSDDARYDESPFIDAMATHLGRPVQKVRLDLWPEQVLPLLETLCWYNDEPVASFGNLAHYQLMQRAKEHGITVILSGQGADELLCGYRKYLGFYLQSLVRARRYVEAGRVAAGFLRNGTVLTQFTLAEASRYLPRVVARRNDGILGPRLRGTPALGVGLGEGSLQDRQWLDFTRFSIPLLTHTEDRMSMSHGREIRLPFLDVRLMDQLLPAPADYKLRDGWTKYALRKAFAGRLPPSVVWRKDKQGFVNPQVEWLRDRLRPAVLEAFGPESLIFQHGLVDRRALLELYDRYCRPHGSGIFFLQIFSPLALEVWMRRYQAYLSS